METPNPIGSGPLPDDRPNFLFALLGFLIPLVGGIIYLAEKDKIPLRARSAGRGALAGLCVQMLLVPLLLVGAILFPVFARARENARRAECQKHMQQLCLAAITYAANNGDNLPDISTAQAIQAMTKSPFTPAEGNPADVCPSDGLAYRGNPRVSGKNRNEFEYPSTTVLFYETDKVHFEGCNVAFLDGHVKWYHTSDFYLMKMAEGLP